MHDAVLERIHQILVNLVRNFNISTHAYIEEDDTWMGILAATEFFSYLNNQ